MRHAIIVGSGIAGPLAAIGLQKAGVSSTLYEAYSESAGLLAGAWLTVAVNGLDAMRTLGVHEAVLACGFASETIELFNGEGRRLGAVPIGGSLTDGTVTHTMKRSALYRCVCEEATRRGIGIEYRKRLTGVVEHPEGVEACFEDGTTARGDFLVGADGVHSRVRRVLDPGAPDPRYTGLGNLGGFVQQPSLMGQGDYRMVFGKRAFFGYTQAPSGEIWWFANPPSARELSRAELAATDWRARLLDLFAGDQGPMIELIEQTPGLLSCTNQYDLDRVPCWNRGRIVAIGDAVHAASPSSGQGVSMAAEDAVALALCVRDHEDTAAALGAFVAARRPRAERVVAHGKRFANTKTAGPVGRFFRDLTLPLVFRLQPRLAGPASLAWLFHHHLDWDAPPAPLAARRRTA